VLFNAPDVVSVKGVASLISNAAIEKFISVVTAEITITTELPEVHPALSIIFCNSEAILADLTALLESSKNVVLKNMGMVIPEVKDSASNSAPVVGEEALSASTKRTNIYPSVLGKSVTLYCVFPYKFAKEILAPL
jgi:hypothetical protein